MNQHRLVGTWKLVSQVTYDANNSASPSRGEHPTGLLIYTANGYMSVHLARTEAIDPSLLDLSTERTALEGYVGYYGRYEIDESAQIVAHQVESCSYHGWLGRRLVRSFTFSEADSEEYLTLTASTTAGSDLTRRVLVWQRES
jgi:hypothetical protein